MPPISQKQVKEVRFSVYKRDAGNKDRVPMYMYDLSHAFATNPLQHLLQLWHSI